MNGCDDCTLERSCDDCALYFIASMTGTAYSRGWHWAAAIAGAPLGSVWAAPRAVALANAVAFVDDIAGTDERMLDAFTIAACKGACDRWRAHRRNYEPEPSALAGGAPGTIKQFG